MQQTWQWKKLLRPEMDCDSGLCKLASISSVQQHTPGFQLQANGLGHLPETMQYSVCSVLSITNCTHNAQHKSSDTLELPQDSMYNHGQTDQHLIVLSELFLCSDIRLLHHYPNVNVCLQYVHHLQKHINSNHPSFICSIQIKVIIHERA